MKKLLCWYRRFTRQKTSAALDMTAVVSHTYGSKFGPLTINCQATIWNPLFRTVSTDLLLRCRSFFVGDSPDRFFSRNATNVMMMTFIQLSDNLIDLNRAVSFYCVYICPIYVFRFVIEDGFMRTFARPHTWELDFDNNGGQFIQSTPDDSLLTDNRMTA